MLLWPGYALIYLAFVNVDFTVPALKSWDALADKVIDAVDTCGAVQAGVDLALVNVYLAVHTWKNMCLELEEIK